MTDASIPGTKPAGPFSAWEFELALRYLRARRKEGGIALIAIISYVAIALAVMALIIVMSLLLYGALIGDRATIYCFLIANIRAL